MPVDNANVKTVPKIVSNADKKSQSPKDLEAKQKGLLQSIIDSYWQKIVLSQSHPVVNVSVTLANGSWFGMVECPLCSKEIKVSTQKRQTTERWVVSNFITHLSRLHLQKVDSDKTDSNKLKITNYFQNTSSNLPQNATCSTSTKSTAPPVSNSSTSEITDEKNSDSTETSQNINEKNNMMITTKSSNSMKRNKSTKAKILPQLTDISTKSVESTSLPNISNSTKSTTFTIKRKPVSSQKVIKPLDVVKKMKLKKRTVLNSAVNTPNRIMTRRLTIAKESSDILQDNLSIESVQEDINASNEVFQSAPKENDKFSSENFSCSSMDRANELQ